ncbi:MAG: hypothetical protein IT436_11055 [Phycisphaerales bacterium]|nr:hypothetical protein [Phycisphaerales bacterium]
MKLAMMTLLALMAGTAHADVIYVSQNRFVKADRLGVPGVDFLVSADDFGVFSAIVDTPYDPECDCGGVGEQLSDTTSLGMFAGGRGRAEDGRQIYGGEGESVFDVVFEVTSPTPYRLGGYWAIVWPDTFEPQARITLSDEATAATIFESKYVISGGPTASTDEFDVGGVLPAGHYRMFARGQASYASMSAGTGGYRIGIYSFSLTFPGCLADLNVDGQVDFSDYLEFLNYYDRADPRVDFSGDGQVDFVDYLEYLNLYEAGC